MTLFLQTTLVFFRFFLFVGLFLVWISVIDLLLGSKFKTNLQNDADVLLRGLTQYDVAESTGIVDLSTDCSRTGLSLIGKVAAWTNRRGEESCWTCEVNRLEWFRLKTWKLNNRRLEFTQRKTKTSTIPLSVCLPHSRLTFSFSSSAIRMTFRAKQTRRRNWSIRTCVCEFLWWHSMGGSLMA